MNMYVTVFEQKSGKVYNGNAAFNTSEYMSMSQPLITLPVSTTYLMLGMVSDVSATLVATTHSLQPSGGGAKTYREEGKINTCIHVSLKQYVHVLRMDPNIFFFPLDTLTFCKLTLACFSVDNRENNGSTYNGSVHTCLLWPSSSELYK